MARNQNLIVQAVLAYGAYRVALSGAVGEKLQEMAIKIRDGIGNLGGGDTPGPDGKPKPIPGGFTPPGNCRGDAWQVQYNPNFMGQMVGWQQERSGRKENPFDWAAFRTHQTAIGAPDPGATPPAAFCEFGRARG